MNEKLVEFKKNIKSKKIAVLGIGISNTPLIKYLAGIGANITAFDRECKEKLTLVLNNLKGLKVEYHLGENYLNGLVGFDVIFKTPVVRYDIPELLDEKKRGALITSEMEIFLELCPAQIFAVTGSDGKTTTTTLIYEILKEQGYKCWLGGNIGTPLLDRIDEIKKTDKVVLELSSFQLHTMKRSPDVAVITNITPNHLDIHKSIEEYIEAKRCIFKYQKPENKLVLNYDDKTTRELADEANGKVRFFSRTSNPGIGAFLKEGKLVYTEDGITEKEIILENDILIPGTHNIENYLAAIAAVIEYVGPETVKRVAKTFKGVEHRIELVREFNGVKFYNSSIDSSPNRTIAALNTFEQKVILIAGGKDKNIPYDNLGKVIAEKVKYLILIGPTASVIEKSLRDEIGRTGNGKEIPVIKCDTYEDVVKNAYKNAVKGDIVILSPASTSFDMFKNFEERGRKFKEIVNKL